MSDTIIVRRSGQAPLRVKGEVIAKISSSWNNCTSNYSGSAGQRQTVRIIKTVSGKYVTAVLYETQWEGAHNTEEASVFHSLAECFDFLQESIPNWMMDALVTDFGEENVAEDVE